MSSGIRDKVAILGMGCSRFGERWDMGAEDLMVESFTEALGDAGIDRKQIQAAWLGVVHGRGQHRQVGAAGVDGAAPEQHTRHARGELLRHRHRGLPRRGLRGGRGCLRHRPGRRRGKAQGHRLRRPAGAGDRHAAAAVVAQPVGAGRVRAGRQRLHEPLQGAARRAQARAGRDLRQEPRQRREEPQGAPAQPGELRRHHGLADDRRAAGPVRLLWRVRRLGRGHRHHAGDREVSGQAPGPDGHRQGAAAGAVQRLRRRLQRLGRLVHPHHARRRRSAPTPRPASDARATRSRCSRCTTASPSPSW